MDLSYSFIKYPIDIYVSCQALCLLNKQKREQDLKNDRFSDIKNYSLIDMCCGLDGDGDDELPFIEGSLGTSHGAEYFAWTV